MGDMDQKRSSVDRHPLHVDNRQPEFRHDRPQDGGGKITEMLVINRVELQVVIELGQVRRLNDGHAVIGQYMLDAPDKAVQIRYMSQNVACQEYPGRSV